MQWSYAPAFIATLNLICIENWLNLNVNSKIVSKAVFFIVLLSTICQNLIDFIINSVYINLK